MQFNENRIRERAYQIWESEGKPEGCAAKHWTMACEYESAYEDHSDHNVHHHDVDIHPLKTPQQKKQSKHNHH
ncbi:hypothetical protein GCM10011613_00430 [Cellvibrio zantedeschiae]|uniref:DUF2934 domain-containing protein n=1 Tax=Cellvibrio zantedeschiae TaxID=1237077 RepID=A0ABQ3ANT6_9GAMM|nr:DUF2934 domain-containing protein [Cellvibrio zantedeschiae]GGY61010.1 hypothetical protein GCM10011613_00430 [Cellvibrio zantedeschiae]